MPWRLGDSWKMLRNKDKTFASYRTRLLNRSDFLIVLIAAIALTTIIFAIALFVR